MENVTRKNIIKVVVLSVIIVWILIFFIDYFRARQLKKPVFCLQQETKVYDDGTTYICDGPGYKVYLYNRSSIPITVQFGPFFIKERV